MPIARPLLLALSMAPLFMAPPAQAAEITVNVTRNGEVFDVEARAEFEGGIARTWQVLTDYGRYAEFIPDISESRVIARNGQRVQVEQRGEVRLLFVSFPIDVRLAITEHPQERIVSRAVGGSFREMRSVYSLEAGQGRVLVRYSGRLVPDFYVPPLIGTLVFRRSVETTFSALVDEVERRHRSPAEPSLQPSVQPSVQPVEKK
jgi:ribosome-associated toxin RatA of RatAB toxin-antitoxin module